MRLQVHVLWSNNKQPNRRVSRQLIPNGLNSPHNGNGNSGILPNGTTSNNINTIASFSSQINSPVQITSNELEYELRCSLTQVVELEQSLQDVCEDICSRFTKLYPDDE